MTKNYAPVDTCDSKSKQEEIKRKSLYLIFANPEEDEEVDKRDYIENVIDFARKSKLPCHVEGEGVSFHSGSICIHHDEIKEKTIKRLQKKGFHQLKNIGKIGEEDNKYFEQIVQDEIGGEVIPVIVSIMAVRENNIHVERKLQNITEKTKIPSIRLTENHPDVSVFSHSEIDTEKKNNNQKSQKTVEHYYYPHESELTSKIWYDVDAHVSYFILKAYYEKNPKLFEKEILFIHYSDISCKIRRPMLRSLNSIMKRQNKEALSMHLLKTGKWRFKNKDLIKSFDQKILEYIYEEKLTSDHITDLWSSLSKMGYKPPMHKQEESSIKLTNWDSSCSGILFLTLLKKHYFAGAMQLIETGNIMISYIIIGCVILEDEENYWKTTPLLKEKIQCAKNAFTATAIRITSCIYEADKKAKKECTPNDSECFDKAKKCIKGKNSEYINHAGRLLLNHGYMRDAIDTGNMAYLENETIKNILNKMWFGTKEVNWTLQTMICFTILVAVHIIVLPLLMFNMEKLPLHWFYRMYNLPFMKVYIHMLGFLVLFLAYAYMLLFDYRDDVITYTDGFIIAWMTSFFVDEIKQVIVAIIRGKFVIDWWDVLDWMLIVVYATGMLLKFHDGSGFQITAKVLLVGEFMALCTRILHLCCMTEFLGPKLVVIRKMTTMCLAIDLSIVDEVSIKKCHTKVADTIAFMFIMTIIMVWYSVSFNALLYPNSEFSWEQIEKILSNGYWTLFGELNLDADTSTPPYCTFNRTIYQSGALQRCPTKLGLYLSPYVKAFYGLIAVVLLLNLLIAMYSHTFNEVQQKSDIYWRKKQNCFLEEYSIKTVFPVHLQLLALPGIILAVLWFCYAYYKGKIPNTSKVEKLDLHPMFVRVFLYDTNYDLRLIKTDDAEKKGALQAEGKVDRVEFDSIKRQLDSNGTKQEIQFERDDIRNQEIMKRLQTIEDSLKDLETIKQMIEEIQPPKDIEKN